MLNLRQPLVYQIWDGLNRLLEPIYSRVRTCPARHRLARPRAAVVLLAIYAIRIVIMNNAAAFY